MSTPFRERNPVIIGAVGIAVLLLLLLAAFRAGDLPLIGGGDTYYANFSDASGLKPNDEVRIAGVRVGKVSSIDLEGDHVRVAFKIKTDSRFGDDTGAQIKVKTLLGQMFLALEPSGSGQLAQGATIPTSRTESAYNVVQAFSGLASRVQKINVGRLRKSLNTLADATSTTPAAFKSALHGVSALSQTVASRDEQINVLLKRLKSVSGTLSTHDQDVVDLMKSSNTLLHALVLRRDAIHRLLVSTSTLSKQLTGLVADSRADLKPALQNLQGVVDVLLKNQSNIDESLRVMAPFYRVFASVLGDGPWFDTWIENLPPVGTVGVS
ncbi:MCE family protein [Nocardioides terrisoli]|uniref:MCE family protein n=1 Tax=Nocardioides terrisoli TaxID=3388267 RepID=UPI00287BABC6|nr:MCE family protein [Nocardioides marmorisolisilvae]